jgi:enoyl-CoA hydratase/carnithine racemase
MTKFETLTFEKIEDIGILKINRPKSLNALNLQVLKELDVAFDEIEQILLNSQS